MEDTWRELLDEQAGVVSLAQAASHGCSESMIDSRVRRGVYQRLGRRTVATFAATPTLVARDVAALLANPSAYLSHFSAARVWALKAGDDGRTHIVVPITGRQGKGPRPRSTPSLRVHRSRRLDAKM